MEELVTSVTIFPQHHPGFDTFTIPGDLMPCVLQHMVPMMLGAPPFGTHALAVMNYCGCHNGFQIKILSRKNRMFHLGGAGPWKNGTELKAVNYALCGSREFLSATTDVRQKRCPPTSGCKRRRRKQQLLHQLGKGKESKKTQKDSHGKESKKTQQDSQDLS